MIERFEGENGIRILAEAMADQGIVHGDASIADELTAVSHLQELDRNDVLIIQDRDDNDIYFVISGALEVEANGCRVAERRAGTHVGEMALIDRKARRCATVTAIEKSVVARVKEEDFSRIADQHPSLWRRIAVELCDRLCNRNRMLRWPNAQPHVFICSSVEGLLIAEGIRLNLDHHPSNVSVWTDQVFGPMKHTIEDLERELDIADFAIAVVTADDVVTSRKKQTRAPRDNVVFELGLFMGQLGRARTIVVSPRGTDLKLPSDLIGLKPLEYTVPDDPTDQRRLAESLGPVCTQLKAEFDQHGPRKLRIQRI